MANLKSKEELFNAELKSRLTLLTPNFIDIRDTMGIPPEVGLGFLPQVHGENCLGVLPLLERRGKNRGLYYPYYTDILGLGLDYARFSKQDQANMVYTPDEQFDTPSLVSIYQRPPKATGEVVEERLLNAPDIVFEGIMAHELAHMFQRGLTPPESIKNFVDQRKRKIDELWLDQTKWDEVKTEYDSTNEAETDVVASMLGFRQQILAKIVYLTSCLETYPGAQDRGYSLFKTVGTAIGEMEIRIKEVVRNVPA